MDTKSYNMTEVSIGHKLLSKLSGTGWDTSLRMFLRSMEMQEIVDKLALEVSDGKRFTPRLRDIMRPFQLCPRDKCRVVFLVDNVIPYLDVADGLCLSISSGYKGSIVEQVLLLEEVNKTVYGGKEVSISRDLSRWSEQGILMLNTMLTDRLDRRGSHGEVWRPWTCNLLDTMRDMDVVYVFFGSAADYADMVPDNRVKLYVPEVVHSKEINVWDSGGLFLEINKLIKPEIIW